MTATKRPPPTTPDIAVANIPAALKALPQWVGWKYERRDGKRTKVPYDPQTGYRAKTNDRGTWRSFEVALSKVREDGFDGIGFLFSSDDSYCGIDLDECLDAAGQSCPGARRIIEQLDSYAEVSPSGRGVKVWVKGRLPIDGSGRRTKVRGFGRVELYHHSRFFTVTGARLPDAPEVIEARQGALDVLYGRLFSPPASEAGGGRSSDDEPVFLSSQGRPHWDHRWSWRKALQRAGLHRRPGLTLYSLRHSFATHFLARGSPSDLQQLLGRASYATTERYVRAVAPRLRQAVAALNFNGDRNER